MENKIILNNLEELDYGGREAYNSLRTNLQFCGADLKVFLFTSCSPGEGKSTVSFELARSMAENGKKVIFIDADLRKSVTLSRYKAQSSNKGIRGLSHYLSKQADLEEIICETNINGLSMILTGPLSPNPTELLNGVLFSLLIKYLKLEYDAVLIDSPPLGSVIDAAVIAPQCDGTILIVESNITSHRAATDVKKQLELTGCRILGVVLNKIEPENRKYYKYYGEYK